MSLARFSLEGRIAVVTGAAGLMGMGRATALAFAEAGADVIVSDLITKAENWDLESVAGEIKKMGRRSLAIRADVTKEGEIASLFRQVVQEFGTVDILANVAGVPVDAPLMNITGDLWDKGLNTNLRSVLLCCQEAGKIMMEHKRGSIINWASLAAYHMGRLSVYGISKIGIMHLTGLVARELAPYNIRCNAVAPGLINTDFGYVGVNGVREGSPSGMSTAMREREKTIPLGRFGDAAEVADVALFLASDASRYVTGQTIPVDGGILVN